MLKFTVEFSFITEAVSPRSRRNMHEIQKI